MLIERVGGRCSLHIYAVTGDDEAEYLCEARNEHGVKSTVQQLLVNCISMFCQLYLCSSVSVADRQISMHVCMFLCVLTTERRYVFSMMCLNVQGGPIKREPRFLTFMMLVIPNRRDNEQFYWYFDTFVCKSM